MAAARRAGSARAERAVERMVGDGRRAAEVVRRLRALTRKEEPSRLPLDLNELVEEALPLVRHEFSRHQIVLQLELCRDYLRCSVIQCSCSRS